MSAYLRTKTFLAQEDMGNDILMARVDLTPVLDGHVSDAYRLTPFPSSMLTHTYPLLSVPPFVFYPSGPAVPISPSPSTPPSTLPFSALRDCTAVSPK